MKVFIPEHLRSLKVVEQLRKMIIEYNTGVDENGNSYITDIKDSFSNYKYMLKLDPVRKFLIMCIKEDDIEEGQDYDSVIDYYAHLFYSVKGTKKVIEYMESYLTGLSLKREIVYSTKTILIEIEELVEEDQENFMNALKGFIDALLYCAVDSVSIDKIRLILDDDIITKVGYVAYPYENNIIDEFKL